MDLTLRKNLTEKLTTLKESGVLLGTSSWKYPGWCGQLYDEQRYLTRGKFSDAKFERECLAEYAEVFSTVCVDAGYYQFPTEKWLEKLCEPVPQDFLFSFKVTEIITRKHFPNLPRHGTHAGKANEHFLSAGLFHSSFLRPCKAFWEHIGVLIFEFSQFYPRDFERGRDFVKALDDFLEQLPKDWQFAVEIRNPNFLHPEYFAVLQKHGVAHVFNSWTRMPEVNEQMAIGESMTTDFVAGRFLLTPGRTFEEGVTAFKPYKEVRAKDEKARESARKLIATAVSKTKRKSYLYVNNRLEGNALQTISAIVNS